jgi:ATP-dependent Lhr-like helicase
MLVARDGNWHTWWTWAGGRGNLTLAHALEALDPGLVAEDGRTNDFTLRISAEAGAGRLRVTLQKLLTGPWEVPSVPIDERALRGLKFSDMLPADLAADTISRRLIDGPAAAFVAARALRDHT